MKRLSCNINYVKDKERFLTEPGEFAPEVHALWYLMLVTKVNRLFTKEDLWQLVYRMQWLFPEIGFTDKFLLDDEVAEYKYHGMKHSLMLTDVEQLIGSMVIDTPLSFESLESFKSNPASKYNAAGVLGMLLPVRLDLPQYDNAGEEMSVNHENEYWMKHDVSSKAKVFADSVCSAIPEAAWERIDMEYADKIREFEARKNAGPHAVFDWDAYSNEQKKEVCDIVWEDFCDIEEGPDCESYHVMHLCWALIYGYVKLEPYGAYEDRECLSEVYSEYIDYDQYEIPDECGGISMCDYYEVLGLNRVLGKMIEWEGKDKKDYKELLEFE